MTGDHPQQESFLAVAKELQTGYGRKTVTAGIHFSLRKGEILAVIGPNGSGKSTLLKTVAGFLPIQGGSLWLDGKPLEQMKQSERAKFLSVVTTHRPDVEWMKVWDVAASGRYPYTGKLGILSEEDRRIVRDALLKLRLEDLSGRYFSELSDGQKQRALLAKSIAQRPKLLILDEPTAFLDIRYQLEFMQIASALVREEGMALMMSLQELSIVRSLADRVLTLKDGRQDRFGDRGMLTKAYIRQLYTIPEGVSLAPVSDAAPFVSS